MLASRGDCAHGDGAGEGGRGGEDGNGGRGIVNNIGKVFAQGKLVKQGCVHRCVGKGRAENCGLEEKRGCSLFERCALWPSF